MDCGLPCRTLSAGLRAGLLTISPFGEVTALGVASAPMRALVEADFSLGGLGTGESDLGVCELSGRFVGTGLRRLSVPLSPFEGLLAWSSEPSARRVLAAAGISF